MWYITSSVDNAPPQASDLYSGVDICDLKERRSIRHFDAKRLYFQNGNGGPPFEGIVLEWSQGLGVKNLACMLDESENVCDVERCIFGEKQIGQGDWLS